MKNSRLLALLVVPLLLPAGRAQVLKLLKDLNQNARQEATSFPKGYVYDPVDSPWRHRFLTTGNACWFSAVDGTHGRELWTAGITPGSVHLVKDIVPGPAGSEPFDFKTYKGKILFSAFTPSTGREVWISDGTGSGTRILADLLPGKEGGGFHDPVVLGGSLLFFARTAANPDRFGLFRYDGGTGSPKLLRGGFSKPWGDPVPAGSFVIFQGETPTLGPTPWISDGTAKGTRVLPGSTNLTYCKGPLALGGIAWFSGFDNMGWGIFRTDGKSCSRVGGIRLSAAWIGPRPCKAYVVFGARTFTLNQYNPYSLDTRTGKVVLLKKISLGYARGYTAPVTWKGQVYFSGADSSFTPYPASSLWRTDGTPKGTMKVVPEGTFPNWGWTCPVAAGNYIFFSGKTWKGNVLWRTDGTPKGTFPLQGSPTQALNTFPSYFTPLKGRLLFTCVNVPGSGELFISDGTKAGTKLLKDIFPGSLTFGSSPSNFTADFDRCWFLASSSTPASSHRELWSSDGTAAGTIRLFPAAKGDVKGIALLPGSLFFSVDGGASSGLWVTDGTGNGTRKIYSGYISANFLANPLSLGDKLLFQGWTSQEGYEPWVSDGTAAGTGLLEDTRPGTSSGGFQGALALGRVALFPGWDPSGSTLWITDGTPQGTRKVRSGLVHCRNLVKLGGKVLFEGEAANSLQGKELWISDGTPKGTKPLLDLYRGIGDGGFRRPFRAGDRVLFLGTDGLSSGPSTFALYRTDGTAKGTVRVGNFLFTDLYPIGSQEGPPALPLQGGRALFWPREPGKTTVTPWVTDGTAKGTFPLKPSFTATWFVAARRIGAGRVFFFTGDPFYRKVFDPTFLWESDGTPAGTHQVKGLQGKGLKVFSDFSLALGKVFFRLDDGNRFGPEPWILDPGGTAQALGASSGPAELVSGDPVLGRTFSMAFRDAPPGALDILLLGFPCKKPLSLGPGRFLYLDPAPGFLWAGLLQGGRASWALPGVPALTGVRLAAQGILFPATAPPLGVDSTNAVILTLGAR